MHVLRKMRRLSIPAMIFIVVSAVGILLIVLMASRADSKAFENLLLEGAKAGIQLLGVGVLGGALGYAWKALATEKDKDAERRAKIRSELTDLVSLYNDLKSTRRSLRSLGLDPKYYGYYQATESTDRHVFTELQAHDFQEQMRFLNKLQLGFESKKRQFHQTDFLGKDTVRVVAKLQMIEVYLNEVVKDVWENSGWIIQAGAPLDIVSTKLEPLFKKTNFRTNATDPLTEITRLINEHVFR